TASLEALAYTKRLPLQFLATLGVRNDSGRIAMDYLDVAGNLVFTRHRPGRFGQHFDQPAGVKLQPYGLWRLENAYRRGVLILVEGESDCWALWFHGFPALGIPGSGSARCLPHEAIETIERIYIFREPDQGGQQFVEGMVRRLCELGFTGKAFMFSLPDGLKDPADLHARDPEQFKAALQAAMAQATPLDVTEPPAKANEPKPSAPVCPVPEWKPFPLDALPEVLRQYVAEGATALGCDPSMIAVPVLATCAGAVGYTRVVSPKRDWREPLVTW